MSCLYFPRCLRRNSYGLIVLIGMIGFGLPRWSWSQANVNEGLETASIYVDAVHGSDSNNGSQSAPLKTIGAAVDMAMANNQASVGSRVTILPGTYRESVLIAGTKRSTTLPITFQAATNGTVFISGADVVAGWTAYSGNSKIFKANWPYNFGVCPAAPPPAPPQQEIVLRAEIVAVNGTPLTQAQYIRRRPLPV